MQKVRFAIGTSLGYMMGYSMGYTVRFRNWDVSWDYVVRHTNWNIVWIPMWDLLKKHVEWTIHLASTVRYMIGIYLGYTMTLMIWIRNGILSASFSDGYVCIWDE